MCRGAWQSRPRLSASSAARSWSATSTTVSATSRLQFSSDEYVLDNEGLHIDVTVTRTGDISGVAQVDYATVDSHLGAFATQKGDYQIALGTLVFSPGETSKTFRILTA